MRYLRSANYNAVQKTAFRHELPKKRLPRGSQSLTLVLERDLDTKLALT